MTVSTEDLEVAFTDFVTYTKTEKKEDFISFKELKFIDNPKTGENYKYEVYIRGREKLDFQNWRVNDIGTGRIHENATNALKVKGNNLVNNFRLKDSFAQIEDIKTIEQILFDFYKSKVLDSLSFEKFVNFGLTYNVIAYLFFLKEKNKYLPISQRVFDDIFELIGLADFKTDGQNSFDNYIQFCNLIKQVQRFLKTKDENATLIDAHSFLWILGQIKANPIHTNNNTAETESNKEIVNEQVEKSVNIQSKVSELTRLMWIEILQDSKITNELDLSIFQALYSFQEYKAYASQIAMILETTHPPLNLEIGRYAKRIAEKYDINFTARNAEKYKFWDLFFNGWDEGTKFIWQLRPELVEALVETGLTGEEILPDELPTETTEELFEGIKKTVTVNSYERNPKARQLCVKHWGAICAVCGIDFEKTYGEIGKGFIHVHHLTPVSRIGKTYQVDPINDLIPVCPNCHSMLHRQEPPLTINKLKKMIFQK